MLRHLFTLIWNRKRANLLLISEVFFSFVVLFGVGAVLITVGKNYFTPHGFNYEQVWRLQVRAGQNLKMPRAELDDVLRQVKAPPGVRTVALTSGNLPFIFNVNNSVFEYKGKKSPVTNYYDADDHYNETMQLHLREGRWFAPADDGSNHRPVVISQDLRESLFGNGPALGKIFTWENPGKEAIKPQDQFQVMGVVEPVRMESDFSAAIPSAWLRLLPYDTTHWETANVLVRVAPGSGGELQEKIARTVAGVTRQWTSQVRVMGFADSRGDKSYNKALSEQRAEAVKSYLVANGSIAADRLSVEPMGEAMPVATNATAAGRQENRRVEIAVRTR